jgi:hypothetical protein
MQDLTPSVVVVAYHSGEALGRLLDSLEGVDEVIVVDTSTIARRSAPLNSR